MGEDIEVIRDKNDMRNWSRAKRAQGEKIGLVPTMGYLHRGHLALVQEAKTRATRVVVSIYINPAQFAAGEDFSTYPSNFEGDLAKLKDMGVDTVFFPSDLYVRDDSAGAGKRQDNNATGCISCLEVRSGNGHETWIRVEKMEKSLCGKSRPIFFKGVATVVAKLFNIVEPDFAFFGKKDYQQWRLICRMVKHDAGYFLSVFYLNNLLRWATALDKCSCWDILLCMFFFLEHFGVLEHMIRDDSVPGGTNNGQRNSTSRF